MDRRMVRVLVVLASLAVASAASAQSEKERADCHRQDEVERLRAVVAEAEQNKCTKKEFLDRHAASRADDEAYRLAGEVHRVGREINTHLDKLREAGFDVPKRTFVWEDAPELTTEYRIRIPRASA